MKMWVSIIALVVLSLALAFVWYSQTEPDLEIQTSEVVAIHIRPGQADTMTIKTKGNWGREIDESITIDPNRCKFYKDDKRPKTIDIVKADDTIEITYVLSEDIKVALNIVVKPN